MHHALIIEPDAERRKVLRQPFTRYDLRDVAFAASNVEARRLLAERYWFLLLGLPVSKGFYRFLKSLHKRCPNTWIIANTGIAEIDAALCRRGLCRDRLKNGDVDALFRDVLARLSGTL